MIYLKRQFFCAMQIKFNVFDKLKVFKALIKIRLEKISRWSYVMDLGSINFKNFNAFYKENGIVKHITILYTMV